MTTPGTIIQTPRQWNIGLEVTGVSPSPLTPSPIGAQDLVPSEVTGTDLRPRTTDTEGPDAPLTPNPSDGTDLKPRATSGDDLRPRMKKG